jgi:hypothetical protein
MIDRIIEEIVHRAHHVLLSAGAAGHRVDCWKMSINTERYLRKVSLYPEPPRNPWDSPPKMVHRLLGYSILIDDTVPRDRISLFDRDGREIGAVSVIE